MNGQAHQADADLPNDYRPQLRRDPARAGLDAVDREAKAATPVTRRQGKDVIIAG
jgi:hypothetical protein